VSILYRVEVIGSLVRRALLNAAGNKWQVRTLPTPECRRAGRPSLLLLTALLFALGGTPASIPALAADASPKPAAASPTPAAQPSPSIAPQALGELGNLIAAGKLDDLRWPNFTDFQAEVVKFYALGANALAWVHDGEPTAQAQAMIRLFKQASLKGLVPDDYDASRWDGRLAKLVPSNPHPADTDLAHFDLALTVCAERYLSALRIGRIDPQHFKFGFDVGPKRYGLAEFLRDQVIESPDVDAVAASLEPQYEGYGRDETALAAYVKLAAQGDGAPLPLPAKAVHPGDAYSGVAPLISRLRQLGDLPPDAAQPADTAVYQGSAVDGVRHFQKRNGLQPDGVLGKETVAELNVPLSQRVKQLQFALERYRWIPSNFPQPPIIVNLPQFKLLTMRRQPAPFLTMRVIVGKAYGHQTPVFADYMRYLIFRPYWEVPMSIQFAELVPKIRRDPSYLADHGFEVTTSSGEVVTDGVVSDDILSQLRSGSLTIRQKPGPKNALGLVKFIFPNHYNVYLHSTPEPELFLKTRRDFSHGCIRVQNPEGLAAWVLRDKPEWTEDKIRAAMNGDQTIQVNLDKPIPVLILYSTAVVEPNGEARFFRDIYNQDSELDKALNNGYPFPS
jgi:L,D-transpeptidase YcbB